MRSEQVFRARKHIPNSYLLCRLAARTTRRLHFVSANTHDAIVDAFERMGYDGFPAGPILTGANATEGATALIATERKAL
jgi:hypothetical protein